MPERNQAYVINNGSPYPPPIIFDAPKLNRKLCKLLVGDMVLNGGRCVLFTFKQETVKENRETLQGAKHAKSFWLFFFFLSIVPS